MRRLLSLVVWFALLWGFWLLLVGTYSDPVEWWGGFGAAALGAVAAEVVRSQGLLSYHVEPALLARLWQPLWRVPYEFGLVTVAFFRQVARPRTPRGSFRVQRVDATGDTPAARGRRAFLGVAGSLAPNALVVDVDARRPELLEHNLDADRASEHPLG